MAGRNLFATEQPIARGRDLFAVAPDEEPQERPTSYLPSGEGLTQTQRRERSGIISDTELPLAQVPLEAIKHIPESAMEFGKAISQPILHPVETVKSLGILAKGVFHKFTPGVQPSEQAVDAIGQFFKERYGGYENIKKTMATDPVGFAADLSLMLQAPKMLSLLGKTKQVNMIAKLGQVEGVKTASTIDRMAEIGKAIEPVKIAGKVIAPVVSKAGTIGKQILGSMTTGVGAEAIGQAYKGSPEFLQALRGEVSASHIVKTAKGALEEVKHLRGENYRNKMSKLKNIKNELDVSPIKKTIEKQLGRHNIKMKSPDELTGAKTLSERFDFSRSTVAGKKSLSDMQEALDVVGDWGSQADDFTPMGLDLLKRRLDDLYSESSRGRAFVTAIKKEVADTISRKYPSYKTMTKEYGQLSDTITEIKRALSLDNRAMVDTATRKLASTMRENFEFRKSLIDKLEEVADVNLKGQIAGLAMQTWTPKGLVGKLTGGSFALHGFMGGLATHFPVIALGLAASSPRTVAEILNLFGKTVRQGQKGGKVVRSAIAPTFQAGRLKEESAQPLTQ